MHKFCQGCVESYSAGRLKERAEWKRREKSRVEEWRREQSGRVEERADEKSGGKSRVGHWSADRHCAPEQVSLEDGPCLLLL